jgi:3'-5' exoribonuclease
MKNLKPIAPGWTAVLAAKTMSKLLIGDFKENETIETSFLVAQKSLLTSKSNRSYLSLKLADRSGEVEGRVWDNVEVIGSCFEKNDFIRVMGRAVVYQDKLQLNIVRVEKLDPQFIDISDFLPTSRRNIDEMEKILLDFIHREVKNSWIQTFLRSIFEDPEILKRFKRAPAAKTNHHAWIGGLLEHVVHLCELARDVLKHYPQVDPDLVYTGLMLHDIGKIYELTYDQFFGYTDDGQLVGHLIQGVEMVYDKIRAIPDFPAKLKTHIVHIILAHHGRLEFGSPKLPMTLEAIMVHYLDDLDSKIQGVLDLSAREGDSDPFWTGFNRLFGRPMYKGTLMDMEESLGSQNIGVRSQEIGVRGQNSKIPSKKQHSKEPLTTNLGESFKKSLEGKS